MKIEKITRTISNCSDYSKLSATAMIDENEDIVKASVELDIKLRQCMNTINDGLEEAEVKKMKLNETVDYLQDALNYVKHIREEIPF